MKKLIMSLFLLLGGGIFSDVLLVHGICMRKNSSLHSQPSRMTIPWSCVMKTTSLSTRCLFPQELPWLSCPLRSLAALKSASLVTPTIIGDISTYSSLVLAAHDGITHHPNCKSSLL